MTRGSMTELPKGEQPAGARESLSDLKEDLCSDRQRGIERS